jgi:hypothetical protein
VQAIQVVDPVTLSIVANITRDNLGSPLTNNGSVGGSTTTSRSWNDAVLVEVLPNLIAYVKREERKCWIHRSAGNDTD